MNHITYHSRMRKHHKKDHQNSTGKYISHDKEYKEVHIDRFNIDFLRYYKKGNVLMALFGICVAIFMFIYYPQLIGYSLILRLEIWYLIIFTGAFVFFIASSSIAYVAGNSLKESARISGRRGLFTFSLMVLGALGYLLFSERIFWNQQFYYFIKLIVITLVYIAIPTVFFDYGFGIIKGFLKKKNN